MMKLFITITIASWIAISNVCSAASWQLIEDNHTVAAGETLESITHAFIEKNTYGPRGVEEFATGIRELNDIKYGEEVHEGQHLRINYWVKK